MTLYLTDINDWEEMSKAYAEVVPEPRPARTAVAVKALPFGTDVSLRLLMLGTHLLTESDRLKSSVSLICRMLCCAMSLVENSKTTLAGAVL